MFSSAINTLGVTWAGRRSLAMLHEWPSNMGPDLAQAGES